MQLPLISGKKISAKLKFTDKLNENMIPIADEALGYAGYLTSHHGLLKTSSLAGESRGAVYNERQKIGFRVVGNNLYKISSSHAAPIAVGYIPGSGKVSMPYSFNTQAIITQQNRLFLFSDAGLVESTSPNLGLVIDGVWIDGYYLLVDSESPFVTDLNNESIIRPLNYGSSEIESDPIIGAGKLHNFAIIFNSTTTEFQDNAALDNYPFQRVEQYTVYTGIVGTHAKTKLPNEAGYFILGAGAGERPSFKILTPGQYQDVITSGVQDIIDSYSPDALADTLIEHVQISDADYIYCHLPKHTVVYSMTASQKLGTHQWSILKSGWEIQSGFNGYWRGIHALRIKADNSVTFGDRLGQGIAALDDSSTNQYGEQQEHLVYSAIYKMPKPESIHSLSPELINGSADIGRYESVSISSTEDGEVYGVEASIKTLEHARRWDSLIWRMLGYYRRWFGVKIKYIGKSNFTIAGLRVNDDV